MKLFPESDFDDLVLPEPMSGCWLWSGSRNQRTGYGQLYRNGLTFAAHRHAFYLSTGIVLTSRDVICHRCDNRLCVNPDHLIRADRAWNARDMIRKGRATWQLDPVAHMLKARRPLSLKRRGQNRIQAKLTEDDVRQIRQRLAGGQSYKSIGREFGVHAKTISQVANGATWDHVV